jgi:hypothetical protein
MRSARGAHSREEVDEITGRVDPERREVTGRGEAEVTHECMSKVRLRVRAGSREGRFI